MFERALIIDDSVPIHKLIRSQMSGEPLELHSAYDGETGLATAAALRPSLILLDVDMPDIDGFEVCRQLKSNVQTTTIPVIFLTADFDTRDKVAGLDLGAVDYITKPFKADELCARVRASLRVKHALDKKAMIDGLTGLWNRQYLEEHLATQMARASRSGRPVSYIAVDIDGLRKINAKHGIPFGDEIIRAIGNIMLSLCRAEDAVCHCEGGSFAVLVSVMGRAGAGYLADRLCREIQRRLLTVRGHEIGVTCSFGVADSLAADQTSLLERANLALRRAKLSGGSCVSIARPLRLPERAAA